MHSCVFAHPPPSPAASVHLLVNRRILRRATMRRFSAAHVPRRSTPLPPLHRPNRVILVKNRSRYQQRSWNNARVNNVSDLGRYGWKENRGKARKDEGEKYREEERAKEKTAVETETGQPLPSLRFAGCSTRFIHEFHFHGHGHGHAIRVATDRPRCFFSPLASFRAFPASADREKNKPRNAFPNVFPTGLIKYLRAFRTSLSSPPPLLRFFASNNINGYRGSSSESQPIPSSVVVDSNVKNGKVKNTRSFSIEKRRGEGEGRDTKTGEEEGSDLVGEVGRSAICDRRLTSVEPNSADYPNALEAR